MTSHYFECSKFGAILYITDRVNSVVMLLPTDMFVLYTKEQLPVVVLCAVYVHFFNGAWLRAC